MVPIEYITVNGVEHAHLKDNAAIFQSYSGPVSQAPAVGQKQLVMFRYLKNSGTGGGLFRLAISGTASDFKFNYQNAQFLLQTVGAATPPKHIFSTEDETTIMHVVEFTGFNANNQYSVNPGASVNFTSGNHSQGLGDFRVIEVCTDFVLPMPVPTDIGPVFDGVAVDAFPAWTTGSNVPILSGGLPTHEINTGFDLGEVDFLLVTISQQDGRQSQTRRLDLDSTFTFDNTHGMIERGPSGRTPEEGYLPMVGVVTNGAVDYPVAAARNPLLVSGNDFDFTKYEGAFDRNLGGDAAAEGVRQPGQLLEHTHTYSDRYHPSFTGRGNGGNVARNGNTVENKITGSVGGNENRPVNVASQWYLIVDTYLEPTAASVASEDLVHEVYINDDTLSSTAINAPVFFDDTAPRVNTLDKLSFGGANNRDVIVPAGYDVYLDASIATLNGSSNINNAGLMAWYSVDDAAIVGTFARVIPVTVAFNVNSSGSAYYYERTTTERRFQLRRVGGNNVNNITTNYKIAATKVQQQVISNATRTVVNGITIREHSDGYIEMWGTDTTGGLTSRTISFPSSITMEDTNYAAHCNIDNPSANRFVQVGSRSTTSFVIKPHNTASDVIWSVRGYRA